MGQEKIKTEITRIDVNNITFDKNKIETIKILPTDSVKLFFNVSGSQSDKEEIKYRILLNGKIYLEESTTSGFDNIILTGLQTGKYIVKVQSYTTDWESESVPIVLRVGSGNSEIIQPELENKSNDNYIIYILLSIILLLIILVLILHKKSERRFNKANQKLMKDYNQLETSYNQLKDNYRFIQNKNIKLEDDIVNLKKNIADLNVSNLELVSQKEKLAATNKRLTALHLKKDEMLAMAVHDIKNPVSAIKGYIELLESYDLTANEQRNIIQSMMETTDHIITVANKITINIADEREEELKIETASIKFIIDSICKRYANYASKKSVKLINQSSADLPELKIDISKIDEVIDNLVNNSIKYAKPDTVVQVKAYFNSENVIIEVVDNGVGFSEEDMKRVFNKGARLSAKPTNNESSSGLGLWIVKKIIDDHNGKIQLTSKQGSGANFKILLPINN